MGVPPLTLSRDSAHHTPCRQRFRMGGILRRIAANRNLRGGAHPFRPTVHKIAPKGMRSLVIVRNVVYNRNRIPW